MYSFFIVELITFCRFVHAGMDNKITAPFGMVPKSVMISPDLTLREKGLYAYLATYADAHTRECTVGVNKIAAECDITTSTVKRCLKILEEKQYIKRFNRGFNKTRITVLLK